MTRRIPAVVVVAVLLGAVAGCGGGDSSSPTGPTSVETPTTTQTPTQTGTSPNGVCAVTSAQATQAPTLRFRSFQQRTHSSACSTNVLRRLG